MTNTPEYVSYRDAMMRCRKTWRKDYPRYGGRGVEFRFDSFQQFYAEVGPRPAGMTLDRIKNEGHYEPGNVRWATPQQQRHNERPPTRRRKLTLLEHRPSVGLEQLREELESMTPVERRELTLDELKAQLAAFESQVGQTGLEAR